MTQLIYNNVDITNDISIKKCVLYDRAGDMADDVATVFPDSLKLWGKWNPQKGDTLVVNSDKFSTGLMYVDGVSQSAGVFTITAISTPLSAKRPKTRIWRNVSLSEIITDVAKNNNLNVEKYAIQDFRYLAISQINQSDLEFLNNICIKEGYCCKITNNKLIVFAEKYMENQDATIILTPQDVFPEYSFSLSDMLLNSFTVLFNKPFGSLISYTYSDDGIIGGADRRIEFLSDISEAERWAKGYLRYTNKYKLTAIIPMRGLTDIAAGSVINLKDFGVFDSKYYIYKVSQDTVNNKSYLYLRQPIEKY